MTPEPSTYLPGAMSNIGTVRLTSGGSPSASREVAEEFEAVFLHNMLDAMFKTVEGGGTFGDSNAADTWRAMLSEQYATSIVKSGGIGIADAVQRELIAVQEGSYQ